jgi:hypothetical protein
LREREGSGIRDHGARGKVDDTRIKDRGSKRAKKGKKHYVSKRGCEGGVREGRKSREET